MFVVEDSSERSEVQRPTEIKASYLNLPEKEQELYLKKRHDQRIDKLFDIPLTMSICMLAMAHGSNEINVSAPLAAEIFMLTPLQTQIEATQEYIAILVGLVTVILGSVTLGVRYLDKFRSKFMKVTLSNGTISNTIVSLCLFFASFFGFTVSSTYILAPCLLLLSKKDRKKGINLYKAAQAVIFAISITLGSMFLSVGVSYVLLWLDYHGPYSNLSPYINLDPYQDFTT
jgi:phosphate/sulfate permease